MIFGNEMDSTVYMPGKAVAKSPFKDVPKTHVFYKAILWGAQEGITKGYTGSHKTGKIRKVSGYLKVYEMGFSRDDAIDYLYSIDNRRRIQGWKDFKVNIYI